MSGLNPSNPDIHTFMPPAKKIQQIVPEKKQTIKSRKITIVPANKLLHPICP